MRVVVLCIACAVMSTTAAAQSSWQEYEYPDQQFAISFPGEPSIQKLPVKTVEGVTAPETLYTVRHERDLFQVAVLDLARVHYDRRRIFAEIVDDVTKRAQVKFTSPARVQGTMGVYLTMIGRTGNHSVGGIFLANDRLYEVEGTVPATNEDALSGEMARFEQSLRFTGTAGRVVRPQVTDDPLLLDRLFGLSRFPRPLQ